MQPDETLVFPYEDVLVPTDGSDAATHAAKHVAELAASLGATVHVLSVVDDSGLAPDVRDAIAGADSEQAATEAVDAVVSATEQLGVTNTVRDVEHGTPVEEILDYVESNELQAVGMGTTGRRGTDRILLGSVAEKTVRSAPVPVITVPEPE
jgi:nucleotide-binding universal stress UspA family protein